MTREEQIRNAIDTTFPIPPSEKGRNYEQALMATGFEAGVKWADNNPKSPWISVEDDLPCNYEELIDTTRHCTVSKDVIVRHKDGSMTFDRMIKNYKSQLIFLSDVTHWMPLPKLPK